MDDFFSTIFHQSDTGYKKASFSLSLPSLPVTMLLSTLSLLLALAGLASPQRVSAPECTDGSPASCVCGDGSEPNYSKFPPCELKKVIFSF